MAIPSTSAGLPIARAQYMDRGENIDVSQVLGPGEVVNAGQTANNQLYGQAMAQDGVTAHAGGGQANGVPVTTPMIRVTTVGTAGDSITLPPSIRGMQIDVLNDAALNAMNVFPATGETINGAAVNTALSVAAQNGAGSGPTIFYCFTNGAWRTK
jgi:hypothetical protein